MFKSKFNLKTDFISSFELFKTRIYDQYLYNVTAAVYRDLKLEHENSLENLILDCFMVAEPYLSLRVNW